MDEFNKLFKYPFITLNITGLNPYTKKDKFWLMHYSAVNIPFTVVFIIVVYNMICHDLKANDFCQMCKNGVVSLMYIVVTFQSIILMFHRSELISLMEDIKKDFHTFNNLSKDEQEIMTFYSKQGYSICKQWVLMCTSAFILFISKNLFVTWYYYWIGEARLVQYYDLKYPSFFEPYKDNLIVFCVLYVLLASYGVLCGIMYAAFVPLGPIFMLHACGQLDQMKFKCNKLFDEHDDEIINMKIKEIVTQSQYVYGFVKRINNCFKLIYELTLKGTTLVLPITLYALIESMQAGGITLEFITFIFSGTLISSSPCYYSDLLMEKGADFRMALYCSGWERYYNRQTRSTILIMLARALRPVAIKSIFRTLCLDTLAELFHQSYALFNLMNIMWK